MKTMATRAKQINFVQADRLTPETRKGCDSQNSIRKIERRPEVEARHIDGHKSNRLIDAKISFYGIN